MKITHFILCVQMFAISLVKNIVFEGVLRATASKLQNFLSFKKFVPLKTIFFAKLANRLFPIFSRPPFIRDFYTSKRTFELSFKMLEVHMFFVFHLFF